MRLRTVSSSQCFTRGRLDSSFYLSTGVAARDRVARVSPNGATPLGDAAAAIWQPLRFKRVYAGIGEGAVPYLRPYDVFEYLPRPADWLSAERSENLSRYRIAPGTVLITCSGRNLGPLTIADEHLSRFALSHDMVRVEIPDLPTRSMVFAFLASPTGQALIRQRMSGSVIDHLTTADVRDVALPDTDASIVKKVHRDITQSVTMMTAGRQLLSGVVTRTGELLPPAQRAGAAKAGWSRSVAQLRGAGRVDAHFHDPHLDGLRRDLETLGGVRLDEVAETFLPGRYKRYYVGPEHGRPILSGRQILQTDPINLRYISDRSFQDPAVMELRPGMVVFGAVGRWEGRLGDPTLIGRDRAGWLASNDVMRLTPRSGVSASWLWRAVASPQVQAQIAALPYGSVVDHTGPEDINGLMLPPADAELDELAAEGWRLVDKALTAKRRAVSQVEEAIEAEAADIPLGPVSG